MTPLHRDINSVLNEQVDFHQQLSECIEALNTTSPQFTVEGLNNVLDRINHRINGSRISDTDKNVIARSLAAMAMIKKNQNHADKGPKLRDLFKKCSSNVANDLENIAPGSMARLSTVVTHLRTDLDGSRSLTKNLIKDLRDFKLDAKAS